MEDNKPKDSVNKNLLAVCLTLIAISIVISGAVLYSRSNSSDTGSNKVVSQQHQQTAPAPTTVDVNKVNIEGNPYIGKNNAQITIAYWYDYQCPFCKRIEQQVMPQLIADYVNTGKAKIVFKDYQFLGADSQTAGWAARAVWEVAPDKFYEWHKAMFDKQDSENSGWGSKSDILALTKSLGIDSAKVDNLMTTKVQEYQKAMDSDKAEGTSFGINGTPGTIIGKQLVVGAQPFSAFKAAIDSELNGK